MTFQIFQKKEGRMPPKKSSATQKGNINAVDINKKKLAEELVAVGKDQLSHPPNWLINKKALEEWNRLVKEFDKKSMIGNLDYNNLGVYCNAFVKYLEATKDIEKNGTYIFKSPNPAVAIQMKYSEEMRKYSSLLGLSTESRLSIGENILNGKSAGLGEEMGDI